MTDKKHAQADPQTPELISIAERLEILEPPEEQAAYRMSYTSPEIQALSMINTSKRGLTKGQNDTINVTGSLVVNTGKQRITIEKYEEIGEPFGIFTVKLLHYALSELASHNNHKETDPYKINTRVIFPLDDFILAMSRKEANKDSRKYYTKKINESGWLLRHLFISWEEPTKKDYELPQDEIMITLANVQSGNVHIYFNMPYCRAILHTFPYPQAQSLFGTDDRTPAAYVLGNRLNTYYAIDKNKAINPDTGEITGGQYDIISVKTILDWLSHYIPSYDQVKNEFNRNYKAKIVRPLMNALNELVRAGSVKYSFCNAKKEPLTKEQQAGVKTEYYKTIKDLYIQFEIVDYPHEKSTGRMIDSLAKAKQLEGKEKPSKTTAKSKKGG